MRIDPGSISVAVASKYVLAIVGVVAASRVDMAHSTVHVLAFAPWVVGGGILYAGAQAMAFDGVYAQILYPPTVYVGVAGGAAFTFTGATRVESATAWTVPSVVGGVALALTAAAILGVFIANGGMTRVTWPVSALITAGVVALGVWSTVRRHAPDITSATGSLGLFAVFGLVLDAVTTVVGVDILGFDERVPLSAAVLDLAGTLPTADVVGMGWLFFVTKLVLVIAIVALIAPTSRAPRDWECLAFGILAAIGLGPGVHNVFLYALA